MTRLMLVLLSFALLPLSAASAQFSRFHAGTVFTDFGKIADVKTDLPIPEGTVFKVSFDTSKKAKVGTLNRTLDSAARFINMHVAAGVPLQNIKVAIVIHGGASQDLTKDSYYGTHNDSAKNGSAAAIRQLLDKGVRIILCGQSAAYYQVDNADLIPGVEMALSAMTAHALLQQDGYTLNPF